METVSNNELLENLKPGSRGAAFLDGARGIAAILVLLGHAKLMLLRDARSIPNISLIQKAFYFWTNLGDSAVMVFLCCQAFWWAAVSFERAGAVTLAGGLMLQPEYLGSIRF
jgi:peptidoglycan/LPS O-acetylase OafA/YrhL